MTVVDLKRRGLKRRKPAPRDLEPFEKASGAARFFQRMIREIENDLGGRRHLSRIESELIRAFAGAATTLQYLNLQVAIGEFERGRSHRLRDHGQYHGADWQPARPIAAPA